MECNEEVLEKTLKIINKRQSHQKANRVCRELGHIEQGETMTQLKEEE